MNLLCAYCNLAAKFYCGRCGVETYCSKKCQKSAFPQHRFHCSVLPNLLNFRPLFPINGEYSESSGKCQKIQFTTNNWIITAERKLPQTANASKINAEIEHPKPFEPTRKSTEFDLTKTLDLSHTPKKHFNDSVSTISHSSPRTNEISYRPILYSDLRHRELTPGRHPVIISHANPSKKMFCVMENSDELGNFLKSIARAVRKCQKNYFPPGYEPKCEEMVLAQYQGTYYRGCVIDKVGEDFIVLFVDFGNQGAAKINQMKPFDKLLMMDLVNIDVYFRNIPVPLTKKAKDLLRTETGLQINVLEQRTAEGCYIADLIGL